MKTKSLTIFEVIRWIPFLCLSIIFIGCSKDENPQSAAENPQPSSETPLYQYTIPEQKQDGWTVASIENVSIDKAELETAVSKIIERKFVNISSLLITRDGKLVLDELFRRNLDANDAAVTNTDLNVHTLQSATKSFTSALVGIAIEKGYINSVDVGFYSLFPEYESFENWSERKNDITLENVLTMQHGWRYNEWDYPIESDQNTLYYIYRNYTDFVKGMLDQPMDTNPGTTFTYATMASHALGAAVGNQAGQSFTAFAREHLFEPLEFDKVYWLYSPKNRAMAGCCLFISGRDMTKLGQLFLDDGQWNGTQILSSDWIEKSVTRTVGINLGFSDGYGYQWWTKEFSLNRQTLDSYFAAGNGGQFIYVFPSLNAVISFTGENYGSQTMYQVTSLLEDYLLKAFK
ncbi:beta-lactamase family protein [Muricauda sp. 2012CJ35-5]|uniref:Beta-lactamase family protein n=1 Tax=Flagellimonas spongiicola TaxID=2942208 RepID=A0ABT0PVJ6_9FLAO|nr:serine hydrolase [Allomuricauda spongiicola]MCL6275417.1 beta-lactamase family protein [Allomuricauda spongiicola]